MKLKKLALATGLAMGVILAVPGVTGAMEQQGGAMQDHDGKAAMKTGTAHDTLSRPAGEYEDIDVLNSAGEEIGEVEEIVQDKNSGKLYAVIEVGGFLGLGEKEVAIPIDQLQVMGDDLVAPLANTADELASHGEYREEMFTEAPDELTVEIGGGMAATAATASTIGNDRTPYTSRIGFGTLDVNRDGQLSKAEAAEHIEVSDEWDDLDKNDDGYVDRSEFSAFEVSEDGGAMEPGRDDMKSSDDGLDTSKDGMPASHDEKGDRPAY